MKTTRIEIYQFQIDPEIDISHPQNHVELRIETGKKPTFQSTEVFFGDLKEIKRLRDALSEMINFYEALPK